MIRTIVQYGLSFSQWFFGLTCLLASAGALVEAPLFALGAFGLGLGLLPPVRMWVRGRLPAEQFRYLSWALPAVAVLFLALGAPPEESVPVAAPTESERAEVEPASESDTTALGDAPVVPGAASAPADTNTGTANGESEVSASSSASEVVAKVVRVIDGDTIAVRLDGAEVRVRYLGIDTPEYNGSVPECYAEAATERNRALVAGKQVRLVPDAELRDDYGRSLYYVYVGDTFVNATLLQEGFARLLVIPPNTRFFDEFVEWRDTARADERGLWAECQ